jgi:hypothetical protein
LDEVLELMDKTAKRLQKTFDESKETAAKQAAVYEQLLHSPQASEEQKIRAFLVKSQELERLERVSSQLSLLYTLQIFAFKVKVLQVSVNKISEEMSKSGVPQNSAELDDVKKNIDALKILVEAQYESMRQIREDQNKTLSYIH